MCMSTEMCSPTELRSSVFCSVISVCVFFTFRSLSTLYCRLFEFASSFTCVVDWCLACLPAVGELSWVGGSSWESVARRSAGVRDVVTQPTDMS